MTKIREKKRKRLILLDAHAILHRAYHALPDFSTKSGEPTGALYGLSAMLIKIIEDLEPDYIVACYDVKGPTYRHEAYKEYKAGRKKAEDDLVAQMISSRKIFEALNIPIYDKQGFEADDIIGTVVEQMRKSAQVRKVQGASDAEQLEIIIASGDMDTMQLISGEEVKVYTLKKGINDTIMYDEKAINDRFGFGPKLIADYKGLRGDPSDNIPGIKGIGEKTATMLIAAFGSIENIYKELESGHEKKFETAGISPRLIQVLKENKEEAEFSKTLATIRLDVPIDFVLPEKTFKENIDIGKIGALWRELEFRTLPQRFEKVVGISQNVVTISRHHPDSDKRDVTFGGGSEVSASPMFISSMKHDDLEKTAIALWLVDSNITNPSLEDILRFADANDFETAKKVIFDELDKRNLRKVYETIELPLIPIVHKMEKRGIKVDRAFLEDLSKKYHLVIESLEKKIWDAAGEAFNINSPKQLGELLFDKLGLKVKNQKKTAGGARSTKESELEKMRDMHPVIPMIFEYRELAKLLSTYIDAIPPLLDTGNRLHTHFLQSGTTTGRMASEEPNLQNIPVRSDLGKAIRETFIAEKGFKLVALDYSQIELRIAAFMSGDEKLIDIFKKGEDVHTSVASFVFNVAPKDVTPEMRRQAKVINFGIVYGMGVIALKQNLGSTREDAQRFLNDYFNTFSTLARYLDDVKKETAQRGYTETLFGRRRYFEGINSKIPYIKAQAERMAINAPIQGTEADIIKLAMIKIDEYLKNKRLEDIVFPLLQVHDELILEIREDRAEEIAREIKSIMESVIDKKETKGIVMAAQIHIGMNWGDLK
jgi:DNA polymerase I